MPAIEAQLPAIAAIIEKAGHAVGPSPLSEDLDQETRVQIGLYVQNLHKLKTLLSRLLAAVQARGRRHAGHTLMIRDVQSWLNTLKLTKID